MKNPHVLTRTVFVQPGEAGRRFVITLNKVTGEMVLSTDIGIVTPVIGKPRDRFATMLFADLGSKDEVWSIRRSQNGTVIRQDSDGVVESWTDSSWKKFSP